MLINYTSNEENIHLMFIININNLKVLNCISHNLSDSHYAEKYKSLKNPKFYLYSNQIEYLALLNLSKIIIL